MNTTINNRTNIISTYQGPSPSIPLDAHRQTTNITQIAARILPSIPIRTGAFGVLPVPMPLNWGTTIPPYTYPSPIYPSMNTAFYTDRSLYSLIPTHYIPVTIYPPVIEKRIFITSDGSRYEGDFLNGQYSGKGVLTYPDGYRYAGDFLNGQFSGKGVLTYPNGVRYAGDFLEGNRSGKGKLFYSNGTILSGIFNNTLFSPDITPLRKPIVIPHNRNPILLLTTTPNGDHNRACRSGLNSRFIQSVEETAHPIMQVSIGSSKELEEYNPDRTIGLLWIFAHGDKHRMVFGEDSTDFSSLKPLLGKLDKNAIVILNSCNTGALTFPPEMPCIAQQILDYLASFGGNPTVIAPTTKDLSIIITFQKTEPSSNRFHFAQYSSEGEIISRHFIRPIKLS